MKQYVGAKASNAGLSPFFDAVGRLGDRAVHGRVQAQVTDRRLPVPAQPDDVPGDHPARLDRRESRHVGQERDDRHGRVQARRTTSTRRARRSCATPAYWGGPAPMDGVKITFYQGSAPMVLALRAGPDRPRHPALAAGGAAPFKKNSKFTYYACRPRRIARSACGPTRACSRIPACGGQSRSRSIARSSWQKIMLGDGQVGNDNPFWKGFASTDPSIKQRTQNLQLAKSLLAAAGATNLKFNLTTWNFLDHPDHAASIQAYAKRGRHRHRHRGHGRRQVLRLRAGRGGLRDDDAVAEPHVHADRVRRARCAEHLPHPVPTCRPVTGTRRTTRTRSSTRSRRRISRRPSSRRSGRRRSGWRGCCSATRRSSPTTSSTT